MKTIILIALTLISSISFGQKSEVKKAIKNNSYSEYQYFATLRNNKMIDPKKLIKWFNKNKEDYYLIDYKLEKKWFAGTTRSLISSFSFVKVADFQKYNKLQAEKIQQKATESKYRASTTDVIAMGTAVLLFGLVINCASDIITNFPSNYANYSPSTSSGSSSSPSSSSASCTITVKSDGTTSSGKPYFVATITNGKKTKDYGFYYHKWSGFGSSREGYYEYNLVEYEDYLGETLDEAKVKLVEINCEKLNK